MCFCSDSAEIASIAISKPKQKKHTQTCEVHYLINNNLYDITQKEHRLPDALFVLYHICNNYIQCRPTVTKSVLYSVVCLGAKVQHLVEVIKAHF